MRNKKTYQHVYESMEEMVAAAGQAPPERLGAGFIGRELGDWSAVKAAMSEPWQEGLDEVQWMLFELRKVALPPVKCQRRKARFADDGDEVDHDRLRSGQEYWRSVRRESVTGARTFTIVTDMTTSAYRKSMDILWRGAVSIVVADLLEEQGHRVELWAACRHGAKVGSGNPGYKDGSQYFGAVKLKGSDKPVDISTLTNAVSGWSYRTVFFQDQRSDSRSPAFDSLGACQPIMQDNDDGSLDGIVGNAKLITVKDIWSKDAAVAFAKNVLESINEESK